MYFKKPLITVLVSLQFITISISGFSQIKVPAAIDSLEKMAARQPADTNKVLTLIRLSQSWWMTDVKKAFKPVNEALELSQKLHWLRGIANAENNLGLFISDTGNILDARKHFEISYQLNVQRGSRINVVNNLVNIGRTYSFESDFPKSFDYYFKALAVAEQIRDEQKMALVGNNLSLNFIRQHNAQKGLDYGRYTVIHAALAKDSSAMTKGLSFMGSAYALLKDTAAAIRSEDSAISIARKASLFVDLSDLLTDRSFLESDLNKRIIRELEAEKLLMEVNASSTSHLSNQVKLGLDYLALAKQTTGDENAKLLKKSEDNLRSARAMAMARNNPARLAEVLQGMVLLESYQGRYREALADHIRMTELNDSLFSQENKNKIAGQETKHTVALKDAELAVSQLKLSGQRKTTFALIGGLALLAVIGGLLYGRSRSRKKANAALQKANQELEEANRVKARFFGILSHDLRGPVASLLHFLDIQREAPELLNETQTTSHRRQITQSAENLLNTMEGMLLWSKQQMQSFKPVYKNIFIGDLFLYLEKFFGKPDNIDLVFHSAGDLNVLTDENYLRTIMQNLTSNAIKALYEIPDAKIEWKAHIDGEKIILSIADNGPGLRPEHAKALYDQSVSENAREGFGLHMTRDLAKAIHCRIDLETLPGKGTEFLLTINNQEIFQLNHTPQDSLSAVRI